MHHCKHLTIQITMYCTYNTLWQICALAVCKIYVRKKGAYLIIGNTTSACRSCGIRRQSPITNPCFSNIWKYSVHALRTSLWTCKILQGNNYKPKSEYLFRITKHHSSVNSTPVLYSRDPMFKSQPIDWLFQLRFFIYFLNLSRKMVKEYLILGQNCFFPIPFPKYYLLINPPFCLGYKNPLYLFM